MKKQVLIFSIFNYWWHDIQITQRNVKCEIWLGGIPIKSSQYDQPIPGCIFNIATTSF